jgi:hypothetical protein
MKTFTDSAARVWTVALTIDAAGVTNEEFGAS